MVRMGKILANYKNFFNNSSAVRKAGIMSKKTYYAIKVAEIIENGGNSEDVDTYLNHVCDKEQPVSRAAFKAAIVLAI